MRAMTNSDPIPNEFQIGLWNGAAGAAWVDAQEMLDRMYQPFNDRLVDVVTARGARRVLDLGCGTGSTTLDVARRLDNTGHCTGVDISRPMLELARRRAAEQGVAARFLEADAQVHAFAPASFDMIVSRFGAMFFDNPVSAFANLRRAVTEDAGMALAVWRSAEENPFMTAAESAARPLLPAMPARNFDGPGQFAFADPKRTQRLLEDGGWSRIGFEPLDVICAFPADALDYYLTRLGPVGVALRDADEPTRARVVAAVRTAMAPYVQSNEVRYTAACWLLTAQA
jgi:SAM-dependent methyltransferase